MYDDHAIAGFDMLDHNDIQVQPFDEQDQNKASLFESDEGSSASGAHS